MTAVADKKAKAARQQINSVGTIRGDKAGLASVDGCLTATSLLKKNYSRACRKLCHMYCFIIFAAVKVDTQLSVHYSPCCLVRLGSQGCSGLIGFVVSYSSVMASTPASVC